MKKPQCNINTLKSPLHLKGPHSVPWPHVGSVSSKGELLLFQHQMEMKAVLCTLCSSFGCLRAVFIL